MPNHENFTAHINELISSGKLKQALAEFKTWTIQNADAETQNSITQLSARYAINEKNNNLGSISSTDYGTETNKIMLSILAALTELEENGSIKTQRAHGKSNSTQHAQNIYNIGNLHDANFGTSVRDSKNVNTGNISASSNVTIGDGNNAGVETFKNKKTSWWIGAAAAMAGLIAFIANIGAIKESFFLKEQPKVIAAPTIEPQKQGVINIDSLRDLRDKNPNSHKIYDQLSFKSDTPKNHKRLDALKLEPIENKIKGIPYDVKNKIFVNNRAKVGAIITGDSNKINIKQEF